MLKVLTFAVCPPALPLASCAADCGLKTRRWAEVIPSLKHMVEAAAVMRARVAAAPNGKAAAGTAAKAEVPAGLTGPGNNGCVAACCH